MSKIHVMNRTVKTIAATGVAAALLAACSTASGSPASGATAEKETKSAAQTKPLSFPAADLSWTELPGTGGVKYANVHGDLAGKGPYEAFVRFPAGKDNPMHTHSQNLPTVVLKGTFYAEIDGKRVRYPAGSYYRLVADKPHLSGCEKGEECLLFQYQSDHFDLLPTK